MKELSIDIESYSEVDLRKAGVYRYSEDVSFEILLVAVSIDNGPVTVYDLTKENLPSGHLYKLPKLRIWSYENLVKSTF